MDRLYQTAELGDIDGFRQLLADHPLILHHIPTRPENPLHLCCAAGHLDFTKAILELKPVFAGELNSDGYTPLHLASANGHVQILKEMIQVDSKICRIRGRDGKTALHFAAMRGKTEVISEMLASCEGCLEDVTVQKETALHIAVKYCQFASLIVMLDWIRKTNKDEILNMKDEHGNSVLHLAVWKKHRQVLEWLVGNSPGNLEVNAINNSGLTALDLLLIFPSEAGDREIQDMLHSSGALKARDVTVHVTADASPSRPSLHPSYNNQSSNLIEFFRYHKGRDSPSDVRGILLVIAILVATATYQVGINPPGGTWQDDRGHVAGTSIIGTHNSVVYAILISFNSIGFFVSLYVIGTLTSKFPLQPELMICITALYLTYNMAVTTTCPKNSRVFTIILTSVLPTAVPVIGNLLRKHKVGTERCVRVCTFLNTPGVL
ncbi:uncharacterized protein LOC141616965 [Silene latifolia]|uniref:uncharacterized protein LOC141616965 n=1 Tax=Silene latifolia TaxID=37657 RepID=UPI003D776FC4